MALTQITTHAELARARLATQFKEKPKLAALLDGISAQVQDVEDTLWALLTQRSLDTAVGAQLDDVGVLLNLPRYATEADADYRLKLEARVLVLTSSGTLEETYVVADLVLPLFATGTPVLAIDEGYPAGFVLSVTGATFTEDDAAEFIRSFLRPMKPAGVRGIFTYLLADATDTFCFDGDTGTGFDSGAVGAPNDDGGIWAEAVSTSFD